ncbi:pectin acetylesterase 5-like isoform X2 [Phragmites australis]|uniref:pectin acetylesterase 5-like isoform X2 n=1 Tax=Phragmites australis TaxID=29695 RepID=UPI002D7A375F|nr:pectin acetylesterase 5-like isoform X2 [Phragmites australis]
MPPPSSASAPAAHHLRLWWRRRGRAGAVGATFAVALLAAALLLALSYYASVTPVTSSSSGRRPALVGLTLVRRAEEKGALCLDGSAPGYHLQTGSGSGSRSWLIHLEGGGWCRNLKSCASRKRSMLGSSRYMEHHVEFTGILSDDKYQNPDFYNWNKVKIRYCDGASFSGNVKDELQNGTKFFFRGQRIWEAVMNELLLKGLGHAKQAFLTGCSAGGLATYIHCDAFRALLPKDSSVKCLADGGFFLDVEDISGKRTIRAFYSDVVRLQGLREQFSYCNSNMEPGQVQHVLVPEASDPQHAWLNCRLDISKCSSNQLEILQGFRKDLHDAISELKQKGDWGIYINSCFVHCQSLNSFTWHSPSSPRVNNKTIAEAVGDWFFDRREVKEIDCEYPCNPTCHNLVFAKPFKA